MAFLLRKAGGLAACAGKTTHRPHDDTDRCHLRCVKTGAQVDAAANPGVRVFPRFVADEETEAVVACARDLLERFGRSHALNPRHLRVYNRQMAHLGDERPPINMLRVTGRYEMDDQPIAPWGHGDDLDIDLVPAPLRRLVDRAQATPGLALGKLRDVTINYRHSSFFRLDAHVDPPKDGPNVCIIGLLSDTVLTISKVGPPASTSMDQRRVALESWDPDDVDALVRCNTMVHLHGPARDTLNHGIRLGLLARELADRGAALRDEPPGVLFDFFGTTDDPIRRRPERISVVFAFADPE